MKTNFKYCILNYIHSQLLEEKVNVGVLFFFSSPSKIVFKYPRKFKRIKELYNGFEEWQLKAHLEAIERKVNKISYQSNSIDLFFAERKVEELIEINILKKDATVLQFSEVKTSLQYENDIDLIVENYYNLYFNDYSEKIITREKHDNTFLIKEITSKILIKNKAIEHYLRKDFEIKAEKTTVDFDIAWKNGSLNLVKAISFDLEEEISINHKAILHQGLFNYIAKEVKNNNYRVDLLIAPPVNNKLIKEYKKAKEILEAADLPKAIIPETEFDGYADRVAREINLSEV